jgi:enamine deaminase RidA (YjgF/YER057c/UK114 family)
MIKRLNPGPLGCDASVFQGLAQFVEVPNDTSTDFAQQLEQLLRQTDKTLEKLGASRQSLLAATIYLTERAYIDELNRQWQAWLPFGCAPSRA